MKTRDTSRSLLNLRFYQRRTAIARRALDLVGRMVVPAAGSERASRTDGKPAPGIVTGIYFPDLMHPYVIVAFAHDDEMMLPHDLDVVSETSSITSVHYARSNPLSHGETPRSDGPAHPGVPGLRPYLDWALRRIEINNLGMGERYEAASDALDAANAAPQAGVEPDLWPHLDWALNRIASSLSVDEGYCAALAALNTPLDILNAASHSGGADA